MQLIATGKWSKADKQWKMVVALRRPVSRGSRPPVGQSERPQSGPRRPRRPTDT